MTDTHEQDPSQRASVVGAYRQFVDNEREKVVAKKQSIAKSEREKQLADLKKFQASFKVNILPSSLSLQHLGSADDQVPLPIPKDILPILAKDAEKQKAIEAKAESSLQAAREAATKKTDIKSPDMGKKSKKIQMSIAVIPPFNPNKGKSPAVVPVPIPDSARANIVDAKSPEGKVPALPAGIAGTAAAAATATGQAKPAEGSLAAKLNPKASAFVFKPNANAPAFKPGQPSSPAVNIARLMVCVAVNRRLSEMTRLIYSRLLAHLYILSLARICRRSTTISGTNSILSVRPVGNCQWQILSVSFLQLS